MNLTNKKNYDGVITLTNHNHPGGSLFDAVDSQGNYCETAVKAGYKYFVVSDHGSFSAMQHCIDYVKKQSLDLKIVYGVEAYVEIPGVDIKDKVAHVILIAKNEEGKHIIDKLNSYAEFLRNGMPVISWNQFKNANFNNNVIATSACISGAPASWLLINDLYEKKIAKLEKELDTNYEDGTRMYISPESDEAKAYLAKLEDTERRINMLKAIKDSKTLEKSLKESNKAARDFLAKGMTAELEAEKAKAVSINEKIEQNKKDLNSAKAELSALKKNVIATRITDYIEISNKISNLKKNIISDEDKLKKADEMLALYDKIFGHGNYFCEVQYHGFTSEDYIYPTLAKLAKERGIPLVAANDAHMADNTERSINMRKVAMFLRFNIWKPEEEANKELYIKTPNELADALRKILPEEWVDEAMMNLNKIAEAIKWEPKKVNHYPKFDKTKDSAKLLREEVEKGIKWRYPNEIGWDEEHRKRIEYELDVIISMGFADYHLIVKDFLEYGRICGLVPIDKLSEVPLSIEGAKAYVKEHHYDVGLGIGVGRGSGAGSLVTYVLGITSIDPFKYGLIFERFLNPERVSMPDIDSDLAIGVREKTIEYVRTKYGINAVVGILTETREGAKGAIKDCARYLSCKQTSNENPKLYLKLGDSIAKLVPEIVGTTFSSMINDEKSVYDLLLDSFSDNENAIAIIKLAKDCEGMLRGYGQHAAAVIIYDDEDITDYIPVKKGNLGIQTEMDMIQCEACGLLKMDFLGLKTLSVITDTLRMIKEKDGIVIDMMNVDPAGEDSARVYENIYKKGKTKNVFQFESSGMRSYLKQLLN